MSGSKSKSKFPLLKRYIRKWQKLLGHMNYSIVFSKMGENEEGDIADIIASMCVVEAQNTVYCRIYPIADAFDDDELWRIACHEVVHISVDKYVGYSRRRLGELNQELGVEEEIRLESMVDHLSKQLVKILPLNQVYGSGKIKGTEEGGDVEYVLADPFHFNGIFGGNTN